MRQMFNPMKYVKAVNAEMDLTHRTTTHPTASTSWLGFFFTFTSCCGLECLHLRPALCWIFLFWNWFRKMTRCFITMTMKCSC